VSYLIIDCLRPVLDALGLDESREAGRWLVPLDALLREAAIPEACVVHHMGHTGERSRGDSRLRDWPDVEWRVMRQEEDDASPRFIAAYGRDVDVPEAGLLFDRATRRLTLHVGSRHQARTARALVAILAILAQKAPLTGRAIKAELTESDHKRDTIDAALKAGVRGGTLIAETGPRNARLYRAAVSECPEVSDGTPGHSLADRVSECPSAFSKADTPDTPSLPLGGSLDPDATPTKPDTRKTKGRTNTPRTRKAATRNTPRSRRAGGGAQ
jgi:hypothetical protein